MNIGEGHELENSIPIGEKISGERKLPAELVDNEVIWVNEGLKTPFSLEVGSSTDVIRFFKRGNGEQEHSLTVQAGDGRGGLLGRVIFGDAYGNYRDVALKGVGYIGADKLGDTGMYVKAMPAHHRHVDGIPFGFLLRKSAERDRDMTEAFVRNGIRTHRVLGISKLKEMVDPQGKIISVEAAKKAGYLGKDDEPVVEILAYGTKARLANVIDNPEYLVDARTIVAGELGVSTKDFSLEDYIKWFSETLAEQLAKMHNAGFTHRVLTMTNITLDCRIVDLESVKPYNRADTAEADKLIGIDIEQARASLDAFIYMTFPRREESKALVYECNQIFDSKYQSSSEKH